MGYGGCKNPVSGVVVNSGNANACTGQQGIDDAKATAGKLGSLIGVNAENVLVCSTGVIGVNLLWTKCLPV